MSNTNSITTRQFLDKEGLSHLWGIINDKFVTKSTAVQVDTFIFDAQDSTVTMKYKDSLDNPTLYTIEMPMADADLGQAGFMSAADKHTIDEIDSKINESAPFHGLQLGDEKSEIYLGSNRRGNIGLQYIHENDQAYIQLVDLSYPSGKSWKEFNDENEFNAAYKDNEGDNRFYTWTKDNLTHYYYWQSDVNEKGPTNNLGEPLMKQAVSKINVTELLKTGLLSETDVVYRAEDTTAGVTAGMYLKLVFNTYNYDVLDENNNPTLEQSTQYINVSDLVDIYEAGEGISIVQESNEDDIDGAGTSANASRISTISLNTATDEKLGGIRTGFETNDTNRNYAIKVDSEIKNEETGEITKQGGNAYVNVPWEKVKISVHSEETNGKDKYINITPNTNTSGYPDITTENGHPLVSWDFDIEVGTGIKNAEALASTSVQEILAATDNQDGSSPYLTVKSEDIEETIGNGESLQKGQKVTLDITDGTKDSLKLADTAVQDIITANSNRSSNNFNAPTNGNDLEVELVNITTDDQNVSTESDYNGEKGEKTIKVTLGQKTITSLDRADTALQTINIMGTDLTAEDTAAGSNTFTVENAKDALELGTAAYVNVSDDTIPIGDINDSAVDAALKSNVIATNGSTLIEDVYHVATARAVKTYVDSQNDAQTTTLQAAITGAIEALDSNNSVGTAAVPNNVNEFNENLYVTAYGSGAAPQQMTIGVTQVDGVITDLTAEPIRIKDIIDFAPLTVNDIDFICGLKTPTN